MAEIQGSDERHQAETEDLQNINLGMDRMWGPGEGHHSQGNGAGSDAYPMCQPLLVIDVF